MNSAKDKQLETLNSMLVETFNAILKVEERSLRLATKDTVTVTEMHILDAIGDAGTRTVTELAEASMVTVSTMTIAINRMEAKELVERVRDQNDRRVVRIRLTGRGKTIAYAHKRFHRRMARAVVGHLSQEELDALIVGMENLRGFFDEESAKFSPSFTADEQEEPDETEKTKN